MSSRISNKRPIQFGKTLTVRELFFNRDGINGFVNSLRSSRPGITEEEVEEEVHKLVRKDSAYNIIMDEVCSAYEFELDEEEIGRRVEGMAGDDAEADREPLRGLVTMGIYRRLIYDDLAQDWSIDVPDEEVVDILQNFYKNTGTPIREYLTDKDKFAEVRSTIREQIITDRLMNAFKVVYKIKEEGAEN